MSKILQNFTIDLIAASLYLAFGSLLTLVVRYGLGISTLSADLERLDQLLDVLLGVDHENASERFGSETTRDVHIVIPDNA